MTPAEIEIWIRLAEKRLAALEHDSMGAIIQRYAEKHPEWVAKLRASPPVAQQ